MIQKRLKALVKVQNPKTIDGFCNTVEKQADYLTKNVLEVVTYLGLELTGGGIHHEDQKLTKNLEDSRTATDAELPMEVSVC